MTGLKLGHALLKRAGRDLVTAHGGGEGAATACRVRQQDLSDYGNAHQAARFMPVDVVADLEALGGEPFVTRTLARNAGFELVRLPDTRPVGRTPIEHIVNLTKEVADVIGHLGACVPGAPKSRADLLAMATEFDQAIAAMIEAKTEALALADSS